MKKSSVISFVLDDKICSVSLEKEGISPTTTVLNYLRKTPGRQGTKEGCAEGDCGACTVVIAELDDKDNLKYTAIDSCLVFLPMLQGKQLITVESLSRNENQETSLHPVQESMVESHGSQCGYCTPGFIMSLFALYKKEQNPDRVSINDALTGNLCRCTGYRPILEAAADACVHKGMDHFSAKEKEIIRLLLSIKHDQADLQLNSGIQNYEQPRSLNEALRLIASRPEALLINGATDIALRVTKKHEVLKELIDISGISQLKSISKNKSVIKLGAGLDLETIKSSVEVELPALFKMLSVFGSRQIRSLATLGGNLGSASPIGDTIPVLFAYKASVLLKSLGGERTLPVEEFITGYRQTMKKPDEIIVEIHIPLPEKSCIISSYKVSKRKDLDISTVSAGFMLKLKDQHIEEIVLAFGGMAEMTRRAKKAEEFLLGKTWNRKNVEEAGEIIYHEFTPLSDARSGAEFRKIAAKNLLIKFWTENKNAND